MCNQFRVFEEGQKVKFVGKPDRQFSEDLIQGKIYSVSTYFGADEPFIIDESGSEVTIIDFPPEKRTHLFELVRQNN